MEEDQPGIAATAGANLVTVSLASGDEVAAEVGPGLDYVVVGDHVTVRRTGDGGDGWTLTSIGERRSTFWRLRGDFTRSDASIQQRHVIAANIDLVVVVVAAAHPKFRPSQLDNYLLLAEHSDVTPLICVNKCDLAELDLSEYEGLGYGIVRTSTKAPIGLDDLRAAITGKTSVFVGSSGVGKTSLLNALAPEAGLKTSYVGKKSDRGRHTTTKSFILRLDDDTIVIDTPGTRALQVLQIDADELPEYFPEFDGLAESCRFRNCSHLHEPDCAVQAAVASGAISPARYATYRRIAERTAR
ncbi:MAG: ribosome biosis GTPase / thiamine phosphate phosphatase [Actinomycetota bacterium]|nr:ribosome biosis GTPase / thiamine phosphate phosphatase [Actinomycetota bacterium]